MSSALVIDHTVNKQIQSIQNKYREKGIDLSYGAIVAMLEHQLYSIVNGMANGDSIVCKYFGTFAAAPTRIEKLNKQYQRKGKQPGLRDTGFMRISFKRDGSLNGETDITNHKKSDSV